MAWKYFFIDYIVNFMVAALCLAGMGICMVSCSLICMDYRRERRQRNDEEIAMQTLRRLNHEPCRPTRIRHLDELNNNLEGEFRLV